MGRDDNSKNSGRLERRKIALKGGILFLISFQIT